MNESLAGTFSDAARKGLAFYDAALKSKLEPDQNGRAIALHVDTEEYVVADTLPEARNAMRQRYPNPDGRVLSRIIGTVANDALDHRLASTRK